MDELFDAMEDPAFCWFIDDYSWAAHMTAEFQQRPFMEELVYVMAINND